VRAERCSTSKQPGQRSSRAFPAIFMQGDNSVATAKRKSPISRVATVDSFMLLGLMLWTMLATRYVGER
jgi:hypothetical protein